MKMRVLSDLHLEFQDWNPPDVEADIIILAGDIHSGTRGVEWARRHFPLMHTMKAALVRWVFIVVMGRTATLLGVLYFFMKCFK